MTNVGNTELITPTIAAPAGGGVLTFKNLFNMKGLPIISYPEVKRVYSERFRGRPNAIRR